jgi:hypothetical protein
VEDQRCSVMMVNKTFTLNARWRAIIEDLANVYARDVNHPFSFYGGAHAMSFGYTRPFDGYTENEMGKGSYMFMLAGIARMFQSVNAIQVHTVERRKFGRLINWVKAHVGLAQTQIERDNKHGGRPSGEKRRRTDDEEPEPEEDAPV